MGTKRKVLKKHASTIHCMNNLSLMSRKISNVLLYHAYPTLKDQDEHEISISHLIKLLSINTNNVDVIKNSLRQLVSTVIEWNILEHDTGAEDWTATSILASVNLSQGICRYSYSPRMKQMLYEPSVYGKVSLLIQARFKSSYGLALYENCSRYRNIQQTKDFSLAEFRQLMGVKDEQYQVFRDFKKRVLDKAVDEVNTCSDLLIKYDLSRLGRKVSNIKFYITEKDVKKRFLGKKIENEIHTDVDNTLTEKLISEFGISKKIVTEIGKNYSNDFILEKIKIIENSKSYKEGQIQDLGAYLLSALKKDYQEPKTSSEAINQKLKKIRNAVVETEVQRKKEDELKRKYSIYKRENFFAHFNTLSEKIMTSLVNDWLHRLSQQCNYNSKRIKRLFKETQFEHVQVAVAFMAYVKNTHLEYFPEELSYETFLSQHERNDVAAL